MRRPALRGVFFTVLSSLAASLPLHAQPLLSEPSPNVSTPSSARRVAGKVIAASTGRGLAGTVLVSSTDASVTARTDGEGKYELLVPGKGRFSLEARAVGFLPQRLVLTAGDVNRGRAPTIALERAATIRGILLDPAGRPIEGAAVVAVVASRLGAQTFSPADPVSDRTVSGPAGGFELRQLRPGETYELRASRAGYFPVAREAIAAAIGAKTRSVELRLQTACAAHGSLHDAEGRAVAGARVFLRPDRRPGAEATSASEPTPETPEPGVLITESDARGRFSFPESPAAEVDLEARKPGHAPAARRRIRVGAEPGASFDLGTLVLQPGVQLAGRVVDRRGRGIAEAEVFLVPDLPLRMSQEERLRTRKPNTKTHTDGRFSIDDLPARLPQHLLVRAPGHLTAAVRGARPPLKTPLVVRMDPATAVRGRVDDEAGEPVAGARVDVSWHAVLPDDPEQRPVGQPILRSARSDTRGRFEIADAPEGKLSLDVAADGFVPIEAFELVTPIADAAEELTLVLRRGVQLQGWVTTTAARPVAGARVSIGGGTAFSDAEGAYTVTGAQAGVQALDVFHPDYRRLVRALTLAEGSNHFDVVLTAGVEVSGRVLDEDGRPVALAEVQLTTEGRSEYHQYQTRTQEDGSFLLHPVAAGRYRLQASARGLASMELAEPLQVEDQSLSDLQLILRRAATLDGRVLGLSPEELAEVVVSAEGEKGETLAAAIDAQGRFEIRDLHPGDWLLRATLWQGQRQVEARVPISSSDRRLTRDLEFSRKVALRGSVSFDLEPLPDGVVSLRGERTGITRSAVTSFDGSFLLEDLEPDRYWLGVNSPQKLLVHNDTLDLLEDREITIQLEAATVAGRVEDEQSGEPIPAAMLILRPLAGPEFLIADSSKPDGTFEIFHVPPGGYRLTVSADGYAATEHDLQLSARVGVADLAIDLARASGLTLQVQLSNGQVPELVHVLAQSQDGGSVLAETHRPGPSGETKLTSLPAGNWEIFVSGVGGAVVSGRVTVPGEPVALTLPGAGRLDVRVSELVTQHLVATLRLFDLNQQPFWKLGAGGQIEQSWNVQGGKAMIDGLPAGAWSVVVEAADGRSWLGTIATPGAGVTAISLE